MKKSIGILLSSILLFSCGPTGKNASIIQGKTEKENIAVVGKIAGRVLEIKVQVGQEVKKGDTLAILDIPELEAKQAQAQGVVNAASAQLQMAQKGATNNQLKQLEAKKKAMEEQYAFAQKSLKRLEAMVKDSLVPQQQYDEVFAKYQGALAQLNAVNAEIADVQNGVRIEQQMMASGQKDQASGVMLEVQTAEKERYIIAPRDMSIENITLQEGELALPGYTLFLGTIENSTYFRFTVPESQLGKYEKGASIEVTVPYKGNQVIAGRIRNIQQIGAYANIATAYPDYEMQDALYEVIVEPVNTNEARSILNKTTVTIKK